MGSTRAPRPAAAWLAAAFLFAGCTRENNPLLATPAGGVTSASMLAVQIDTHDEPFNRVFLQLLDNTAASLQSFELGNFSLLENGRPTVPESVGPVNEPLYIALVIDRSGSMSIQDTGAPVDRNTAATNAGLALVAAMGAQDQMAYIEFDNNITVKVPFTSDQATLNTSISTGTPGGSTALFDAVSTGAGLLKSVQGRKLLIVLGDGDDNASDADQPQAIANVKDAGVSANMIILGTGVSDTSAFSQLAANTGGEFQVSADGTTLNAIFLSILAKMQNLFFVKYRKRSQSGTLTVYLNYGAIMASATRDY